MSSQAPPDRADLRVLLTLLIGAAVIFGIATRLRLGGAPLGDEPHYLASAQALIKYHSVDPTPVYQHRDYWSYYPEEIAPHVVAGPDGRAIPYHNLGGPLLWLLPFLLWGRAGAHLVVLAASVLTVLNMYRLQRDLGIAREYAGLVTGLFVIGTPVYVYSSMLFVEPIGALLILYAVRVVLADPVSPVRLVVASAGLGYLPWVHGRYSGFTVVLGGLLAARLVTRTGRRSAWPYAQGLLPMIALGGGLAAFHLVRYGTVSPTPGYGTSEGVLELAPHRGLLFLALDGRFGLLTNFPILVFAIAGILLAMRRDLLRVQVVLLGTVVPYTLIISTYPNWEGGYAPPGRLLAVVIPVLAYHVALTLQRLHHRLATAAAAGTAAVAFVLALGSDMYPMDRFHWITTPIDIPAARLAVVTGLPLDRLVPLAAKGGQIAPGQWNSFAAWAAVVCAGVVTLWLVGRRPARPAPAPAPAS